MNLALTYSFLAEDALHVRHQIECQWLETDEGHEYDHHPHDGKKGLLDFVIYGGICRSSPGCKRPNLGSDAQGRSRRTVFPLSEPKVTLYFKARYCKYLACEAQLAGNTLLAAQYSHKESDLYGECASFMNAANASLSSFISHCYVIPRLLLSSSFCSPSACCPATRRWCRPFSSRNPCRRRNCNCSLL